MMLKMVAFFFKLLPIIIRCKLQSRFFRGNINIGRNSYIDPSVHLLGRSAIRLGTNSCISELSLLNVNHPRADEYSIDIGNNCFIGQQNFFSSGKKIKIGSYTLTAIGCQFIGSSHLFNDPSLPYLTTGTTDTDVMILGANCLLGANVTILGSISIGCGSVIGASTFVRKDIPPFSLVVGNPGVVIKRFSFLKKEWVSCQEFSDAEELAIPSEKDYLATLNMRFGKVSMPWIAASRRFGGL